MSVASTICVILLLVLLGGWRWYFDSVKARTMMLEKARIHEARIRELERLGFDAEAGILPDLPVAGSAPQVSLQAAVPNSSSRGSAPRGPVPVTGAIKELPLQDKAEDFVEAVATLEGYWRATNTRERLPFVYDAPRVGPLMKKYYEEQGETDPDHTELKQQSRLVLDGEEILYFSYASSRPTGLCEIAMRRNSSGRFVVDWESLAGYSEKSFAEIRQSRPTEPVQVRAYVRLFEYYNYEFGDADQYLCVKLLSVNGVDTLYGYAERDSEIGRWLSTQLAGTKGKGGTLSGATLKIAFPPDPQSNQCVKIVQVACARWLMLN